MRNILYIAPSPRVKGGISSVINGYLNSILPQRHNIFLVSSHVDGPKIVKLIIAIIGLVKTLFHLLLKNIDTVHIHSGDIVSVKRKYVYFKLVRNFNCKIIYHLHGGSFLAQYPTASDKWKKRIKALLEESDLVISLTETWKNAITEIAPCSKIEVIPNAIRLPQIDHLMKKSDNSVQLTFLGLIGEKKGILDLLIVVKRLNEDGYDIKLNIGGNGEVNRLFKEIDFLGISHRVKYLGWICEKERDLLLKKSDVFILPSYAEGMPMSILEAMSYSIPVISTFVGGIPELVSDGESGFLITPGDLDTLYQRLALLVQNDKLRKEFGLKASQIVKSKHNIDIVSRKIDTIYNNL